MSAMRSMKQVKAHDLNGGEVVLVVYEQDGQTGWREVVTVVEEASYVVLFLRPVPCIESSRNRVSVEYGYVFNVLA